MDAVAFVQRANNDYNVILIRRVNFIRIRGVSNGRRASVSFQLTRSFVSPTYKLIKKKKKRRKGEKRQIFISSSLSKPLIPRMIIKENV